MKLRSSSLHFRADAGKNLRSGLCAVWLLAASVMGLTPDAGAAPKSKATPTPTPTPAATPTPTPTPTAAPTATAAPAPTATPTPAAAPTYNGTQQTQYITGARDAFVALRTTKSQPFLDAHRVLDAAGGLSAKGLSSKADIAARRELVAKTAAANDDYLEFVKNQDATYRAELAKTPLTPADIDSSVTLFAEQANTATTLKLREAERDALKAGDDMLVALDKKFGAWTANEAGKITFKKKSDVASFSTLVTKYNAKTEEIQKLRDILKPVATPTPAGSPGTSPAAAAAPGVAPVAATPAATAPAVPAPSAKP